jgi:hypothetical protein
MFRVILASQWKWTRAVLLVMTCAAFALPFLSIRNASRAFAEMNARDLLQNMDGFGVFYAMMAAFIGLLVAAMAWTSDHAGRHVYALSLPIERWKYVAMRFGAGALTLTPPAIALWLGGAVALQSTEIPAGLHTHPLALAIRFALGMLVAYAIFFAISSGTKRTAGVILAVLGVMVGLEIVGDMLNIGLSPFTTLLDILVHWSGALGVFNGRWMLIDV